MLETMYAAPGIGLAATQIDVHKRLIVIDLSKDHNEPLVIINPEILSREGEASSEEGCLSVPEIFDDVKRAAKIRLRGHDRNGAVLEQDYDDILAVCIQHEMDHLEGKLFVDYLSEMKRERIRKKLEKERKERTSQATTRVGRARAAPSDIARSLRGHPGICPAGAGGTQCAPQPRRRSHPARPRCRPRPALERQPRQAGGAGLRCAARAAGLPKI